MGREFTRACAIDVVSLEPYLEGLELAPLVMRLDAFNNQEHWAFRLRRALVTLAPSDACELRAQLLGVTAEPPSDVVGG